MIIWLINPGEPLPIDKNQRLFRTGKLAHNLKKNNKVVWFSSKFDHFTKKFRKTYHAESEGIEYYFVNSIGYKNNLSIRRVLDHFILGFNLLLQVIKIKEKPDIIITAYPPIETSFFLFLYCKFKKIRLICDVRDLWPYTFPHIFKNKLSKILCHVAIFPWVMISKLIFKYTLLITISDGFAKWLNIYSKTEVKRFYLSYEEKKNIQEIKKFKDINLKKEDFIISFVGNYSRIKFDFDLIFDSSKELYNYSNNIKFIFCGDLNNIKNEYSLNNFKNIFFFDWINRAETRNLLNISSIGLAPYKNLWDFNMSIPNKISEYLCYEVPIFSSLNGDTKNLIEKYNCGINFDLKKKEDFIEKVKKVYKDVEFYNNLKNGAKIASKNFHDELVINEMKEFILSKKLPS